MGEWFCGDEFRGPWYIEALMVAGIPIALVAGVPILAVHLFASKPHIPEKQDTQTLESRIKIEPCNAQQRILVVGGQKYCIDYGKLVAEKRPYEECRCDYK